MRDGAGRGLAMSVQISHYDARAEVHGSCDYLPVTGHFTVSFLGSLQVIRGTLNVEISSIAHYLHLYLARKQFYRFLYLPWYSAIT